jgi:hypothetical protein
VKGIVDMPNQRASCLIRFVLQNHGTLSKNKRRQFPELQDDELERIESAIRATSAGNTAIEEFDDSAFDSQT